MAVGNNVSTTLHPVLGVDLGVACAGIKKPNHPDLVVFRFAPNTTMAGVFTQNAFCAAPVQLCKQHLQVTQPLAWLINTGNANAGTGQRGLQDAQQSCQALAQQLSMQPEQILPFSTGVIGEYLPMEKIINAIPQAVHQLSDSHWSQAAQGILTTDTRPKGASRQFDYQGETITITGIAKGSGMIQPNMATMLAFVATNAHIAQPVLSQLLQETNEQSFNRITVDSDTSTNDCCLIAATGQSNLPALTEVKGEFYALFKQQLSDIMRELAHAIVKDGEGATKFVKIAVEQAGSTQEALAVAYSIANSPLVKTALTASDANWGRILMAIGKSPVTDLDVTKIDVWLDEVNIVTGGERADGYSEAAGSQVMAQEELCIRVVLNRGDSADAVYTSDLSYEYIRINAEYRT